MLSPQQDIKVTLVPVDGPPARRAAFASVSSRGAKIETSVREAAVRRLSRGPL